MNDATQIMLAVAAILLALAALIGAIGPWDSHEPAGRYVRDSQDGILDTRTGTYYRLTYNEKRGVFYDVRRLP